jgi:hypothetical protein
MSSRRVLLVVLAAAAVTTAAQAGGASLNGEANDILPMYGLPKGLIPDSVASHSLDEKTGRFEIHLAGTCYVHFGSDLVYYDKTITGTLSYGAIKGLSGVQAKKLFLWVSISGMVAHPDQGTIEFQAGFVSESLSASMFDEVPACGSGVGAQLRGAAGVIGQLGLLSVEEVWLTNCAPDVPNIELHEEFQTLASISLAYSDLSSESQTLTGLAV